jgi:hypothetical protein
MIRMKLEIEPQAHDNLMKVLELCEPPKGHSTLTIVKALDAFFNRANGHEVNIVYSDVKYGGPKGLLDLKESTIKSYKYSQTITIKELIDELVREKHLKPEVFDVQVSGNTHKKRVYKVRKALEEI